MFSSLRWILFFAWWMSCISNAYAFLPLLFSPPTVDYVNTTAYFGRWFQMYASIVPNATFERNGYCVTSDIFPNQTADTVFALTNALRLDSPQGELKTIEGDAYPTHSPGKFKIKFDTVEHTGDYWITALGDPSAENDYLYPWSIVSSAFRTSLFILARNVTQFRSRYQDEVLKIAKKQGFNKSYNSPLPTYQEPDCQYAPHSNTRRALGISTYHDMIRITENSADSKPRNLRKSKFHK